jgi:ElaB/YqjD/DUF883 family membrane-anchored ribosome-binding protein
VPIIGKQLEKLMELFANMSKRELKLIKDRTMRLEKENHSTFERVKKQKEDSKQSTEKIDDLQ